MSGKYNACVDHPVTQRAFRAMVDILSIMMVVALIWRNFIKVAGN